MEVQNVALSVEHVLGRVYLIRCDGPLGGPVPEVVVPAAVQAGARVILVDATSSPYGDSDGLRWLLRLKTIAEGRHMEVRVAAREDGRIWRNVTLLDAGFELFPSVQSAWAGSAAAATAMASPPLPERTRSRDVAYAS